jgi:hypothetical protein
MGRVSPRLDFGNRLEMRWHGRGTLPAAVELGPAAMVATGTLIPGDWGHAAEQQVVEEVARKVR